MDGMSAIEKIELKEEIEKLESLVEVSVANIDQMVYELYGLSDEEIALVEGRDVSSESEIGYNVSYNTHNHWLKQNWFLSYFYYQSV